MIMVGVCRNLPDQQYPTTLFPPEIPVNACGPWIPATDCEWLVNPRTLPVVPCRRYPQHSFQRLLVNKHLENRSFRKL